MIQAIFRLKVLYYYLFGYTKLRPDDIWLASFPKSGITWLRFILFNVLELCNKQQDLVDIIAMNDNLPTFGHYSLLKPWSYQNLPRFVHTHRAYLPIMAIPQTSIYVLRDPRDIMTSYFYYLQAHRWIAYSGEFSELIRHRKYGLEAFFKHYNSWKPHVAYFVRYEKLKSQPITEIEALFSVLNVEIETQIIEVAVEKSTFDNMKALIDEHGIKTADRFDKEYNHTRKGQVGDWQQHFSEQDLTLYTELSNQYEFDCY